MRGMRACVHLIQFLSWPHCASTSAFLTLTVLTSWVPPRLDFNWSMWEKFNSTVGEKKVYTVFAQCWTLGFLQKANTVIRRTQDLTSTKLLRKEKTTQIFPKPDTTLSATNTQDWDVSKHKWQRDSQMVRDSRPPALHHRLSRQNLEMKIIQILGRNYYSLNREVNFKVNPAQSEQAKGQSWCFFFIIFSSWTLPHTEYLSVLHSRSPTFQVQFRSQNKTGFFWYTILGEQLAKHFMVLKKAFYF